MFLPALRRRNPALLRAALELHQAGAIPPNCFVLDLDAIAANAKLLVDAARARGLVLYFMSKQFGHAPPAVAAARASGIESAVAVDARSAAILHRQGVPIGHLGHLVQVPRHQLFWALSLHPQVLTVYGEENARLVSAATARTAPAQSRAISLLLKVCRDGDLTYPGQEGGIPLDDLVRQARSIAALPGVRVAGVTAFPCAEWSVGERRYRGTSNLETLQRAAETLRRELGPEVDQVNAPGATCTESLELLAQAGATSVEPGHALTGTNPHQADVDGAELPAMLYVSEVAHRQAGRALAFGGGIYRRGRLAHALVGRTVGALEEPFLAAHAPAVENIDYTFTLDVPPNADVRVGDTVLCAFRAQVFVGYCSVAAVAGLRDGAPSVVGLYDALGAPYLDWPAR